MGTKKGIWDYALRIRGVTPRTVPLGRMGEYMKAYAALLGDGNQPAYAGVVKGSALLRAAVPIDRRTETRVRLLSVRTDGGYAGTSHGIPNESVVRARDQLAEMLARDGLSGDVEDRSGAVILEFKRPDPKAQEVEHIVQDVGLIDGVVVSLGGTDDTVHLRLLTQQGEVIRVTVRDLAEARKVAPHFRGDVLRAHVHGTWKRTGDGKWEPHALYLDRIEELGDEPASELLSRLSMLPGNRWGTMDDPQSLLRTIRGDD